MPEALLPPVFELSCLSPEPLWAFTFVLSPLLGLDAGGEDFDATGEGAAAGADVFFLLSAGSVQSSVFTLALAFCFFSDPVTAAVAASAGASALVASGRFQTRPLPHFAGA